MKKIFQRLRQKLMSLMEKTPTPEQAEQFRQELVSAYDDFKESMSDMPADKYFIDSFKELDGHINEWRK